MSRREYTLDDARDALHHVDAGMSRHEWVRVMAAAKAAGLDFEDVLSWSAAAPNFKNERDVQAAWRGIKTTGAVGAGTLFHEARRAGWKPQAPGEPPRAPRPPAAPARRAFLEQPMHEKLSDFGADLWAQGVPLAGTAGAAYLRARRCVLPPADGHLRFHPALRFPKLGSTPEERAKQPDYTGPALLALVTDALTRVPLNVHRTWIQPDGRKADTPGNSRLMLGRHRKAGGVIRLWPDEAVTTGLGIGEGLETCLTLAHVLTPVWCCIDAGNLKVLPVLDGIEALTFAVDNDPAGRAAAQECSAHWLTAGVRVAFVIAKSAGSDLNDIARSAT